MEMERYEELRRLVRENFSEESLPSVDDALQFAAERLGELRRYDGSPMLDHGVAVAQIVVSEIGLDVHSCVAAILHDVVRIGHREMPAEDFLTLTDEVRRRFGEDVAGIALGLSDISELKLKASKERVSDYRDMIVAYSKDPRVILLKLADRLEVMRSLEMFPPEKWKKKSWESLNLYAQIAHKLGLYELKSELEDISLRYLEPADYQYIKERLEATESECQTFLPRFLVPIIERLDKLGVPYHIKSRTKSIFSIWTKMRKQHVPFEGVYDIFALRIIFDCPREDEKRFCWTIYSIVSDCYVPNPERMRDWISIPKSNGYESLHTTVSAGEGKWVEIQIRSERMDAVAERGIAAHWRYKGVGQDVQTSEKWFGQLRELLEEQEEHSEKSVPRKFDLQPASHEIMVFTPNGDLRKLPEGSTLLDFAFDIHSNLGSTCTGGKVNGRAVSIREVLHNGDIVEVITQKNQKPKSDWLQIVTTSKAKSRIRAFIREEQAKNARMGREELERKLKNWKFALSIDEAVAYLCKALKLRTGMELYGLIATRKIEIGSVKELLTRWVSGQVEDERRAAAAEAERNKLEAAATATGKAAPGDALIIDESINRIEYKLAKCCNPIRGDEIFGFITVGAGITVHRCDCPNARRLRENYPYRVIEAQWRRGAEGSFRATIAVVVDDVPGIVSQITEVVNRDLKINIRSFSLSPRGDGTASGTLTIEVPGTSVIDTVIHSIIRVKGVQKAVRVNL